MARTPSGKTIRVPAMVVAMRSIATDEITAIQRTRLSPEGKKIERRMLGVAGGAAVKLDADERVTDRLNIGEGVETAMTARQIGLKPTWALGSASAIAAFPVLDGVERLGILAEHDEANERATEACGGRWHDAGRKVFIIRPTSGNDLNDALRAMRARSPVGVWPTPRFLTGMDRPMNYRNLYTIERFRPAKPALAPANDRGALASALVRPNGDGHVPSRSQRRAG